MNSKKYLSLLGLARRAGKLSMGHDMSLKAIKENKATLVIFSSEISERLVLEFERAVSEKKEKIPCVKIDEGISEIHSSLGYRAGVLTVNDINFSKRIYELICQEENAYDN